MLNYATFKFMLPSFIKLFLRPFATPEISFKTLPQSSHTRACDSLQTTIAQVLPVSTSRIGGPRGSKCSHVTRCLQNSVIQLGEISECGYQYGPAAAGLGTSARNLPTVLELTHGPEPSEHLNLEIQHIGGEAVNCGADDIIGISSVQSEYGDPNWLVLWGPKCVQGGWVKQLVALRWSRWSKVGPVRKEAKMAVKHVGTFDRGVCDVTELLV
ncbi:hypothetical protein DFH09DRAFT_1085542 [Mycena vulgaris]|nr:hypothetical protein DFH09DRAFT_1085542 [Mycena vulgaris]